MLQDYLRYAFSSLSQRKLRSWLTVIGIFIGIAAVVSLISLGQGLQGAVAAQFSTLGADRITIEPRGGGFGPPGLGSAVKLTEDDLRIVQRSQHIETAAGRLLKPVTAQYNDKTRTTFMASLPDESREQREVVSGFLDPQAEFGRLLDINDRGKVTMGASIAEEDKWDAPVEVGKRIVIEGRAFEVVGILKKRGVPASDSSILMNEEDMRALLGIEEEYSFIVAKVSDTQDVPLAIEAVSKDLRKFRDVDEREEDFTVESSEDLLETVGTVLGAVTGVLVGIAAISLLVGGIGIMSTMYTAVLQRKREIGVMKAIGATNGQVLTLFLIEAGLLGLVGGVIGVLVGVGFSKLVEFGAAQALGPSILQATSPWWLILGALAFSFVVGTLSGILPAKQAAQLPPVEALR